METGDGKQRERQANGHAIRERLYVRAREASARRLFSINDTYQEARKAYDAWRQTSLTVERDCPTGQYGRYDQTRPTYKENARAAKRLNDAKRRHQQACVDAVNNAIQQGDAQTLWRAIMYVLSYNLMTTNGDTNTSTLIDCADWDAMILMGTASTTVTRSASQHPR